MIERQQVNLRLEREFVDLLDDLARSEHVDRTEVARRILVEGVAKARLDRALRDYTAGNVTAWQAASDAGVSLYEMLDRIHEARIPYELDPDDLAAFVSGGSGAAAAQERVAETRADYGAGRNERENRSIAVAETEIADLHQRYRPAKMRILFVGESSPAQGTHFYRANSNLYQATRAAFAEALGDDVVPTGEAFLRFFGDEGCWLVDIADAPVNRMPDAERRRTVELGVNRLADVVRHSRPEHVVAVKRDLEEPVRRALTLATATDTPLLVLPFPVRQWRPRYVEGLAMLLRGGVPTQVDRPDASPSRAPAARGVTRSRLDADMLLRSLIGRELRTITQRKVNRILNVDGKRFLAQTDDSPGGAWEPIAKIQEALDRLVAARELEVTKKSLGHWRTALVGAVLSEVPGVTVASTSPRRLILDRPGRHRSGGAPAVISEHTPCATAGRRHDPGG